MSRHRLWVLTSAVILGAVLASAPLLAAKDREAKQLANDLVGHTMGGRDKCWAFQSKSQIKELVIDDRRTEDGKRVYEVTVLLSDGRVGGLYRAKATVTYEQVKSKWVLRTVGLRSLVKD